MRTRSQEEIFNIKFLNRHLILMHDNKDRVYKALQLIPKGKVATYKLIASYTGIKNPRVIGNILHRNQLPEKYPCHRVVRSDGKIASGYAMGGPSEQVEKLKNEGVAFERERKINLSQSLFSFDA